MFAEEFVAETNRLAAARLHEREDVGRQRAETDRKIAAIIRAIEDGKYSKAMGEHLAGLEARKAELEDQAAQTTTTATPVRLHPNLPQLYARKVGELERLIADETHRAVNDADPLADRQGAADSRGR